MKNAGQTFLSVVPDSVRVPSAFGQDFLEHTRQPTCKAAVPPRGFTYLELIVTMVILAILASAAVPTSRMLIKRKKETTLRDALMEMRIAIDRYKRAIEEGVIQNTPLDQYGYPADLTELIEGAPTSKDPQIKIRFLRKVPMDPMTGEAEWGKRSVQDEFDASSWGGQNVFDVYSLSDGTGIDGTEYSEW